MSRSLSEDASEARAYSREHAAVDEVVTIKPVGYVCAEDREGGKPFVAYLFEATLGGGRRHHFNRRFREFEALRQRCKAYVKLPLLPPKGGPFYGVGLNKQRIHKRYLGLGKWVGSVLDILQDQTSGRTRELCQLFLDFIAQNQAPTPSMRTQVVWHETDHAGAESYGGVGGGGLSNDDYRGSQFSTVGGATGSFADDEDNGDGGRGGDDDGRGESGTGSGKGAAGGRGAGATSPTAQLREQLQGRGGGARGRRRGRAGSGGSSASSGAASGAAEGASNHGSSSSSSSSSSGGGGGGGGGGVRGRQDSEPYMDKEAFAKWQEKVRAWKSDLKARVLEDREAMISRLQTQVKRWKSNMKQRATSAIEELQAKANEESARREKLQKKMERAKVVFSDMQQRLSAAESGAELQGGAAAGSAGAAIAASAGAAKARSDSAVALEALEAAKKEAAAHKRVADRAQANMVFNQSSHTVEIGLLGSITSIPAGDLNHVAHNTERPPP